MLEEDVLDELDRYLGEALRDPRVRSGRDGALRVLEAGCGSIERLSLPRPLELIGVDISEKQLRRNRALDLPVRADLNQLPLRPASVDVVACWYVLEHLPDPVRALDEMAAVLRPGGRMLLAFPNLLSVKGLVTRLTPHRFHVWVYRTILGSRTAGTGDHGPFPTYLRWTIRPAAIREWAAHRGFEVERLDIFESEMQQVMTRRNRWVGLGVRWGGTLLQLLSAGRLRARDSDVVVVLRRG